MDAVLRILLVPLRGWIDRYKSNLLLELVADMLGERKERGVDGPRPDA